MIVKVNPAGIPQELKEIPQWLNWAGIWKNDKLSKPPMRPAGVNGSSTNPNSWSSFERSLEVLGNKATYRDPAGDKHDATLDGVGLGGLEKTPYVGIDLDDCIENGIINDFARNIIDNFKSYTEITVSGNGVRIWIKAEKPPGSWSASTKHGGKIEVYADGRFFTLTGAKLKESPETIEEKQVSLDWLLKAFKPPTPPVPDRKPGISFPDESMEEFLGKNGVQVLKVEQQTACNKYHIVCPWVGLHSGGDKSGTFTLEFHDGAKFFHCYHSHGEGLEWAHLVAEVEPQNYISIKPPPGNVQNRVEPPNRVESVYSPKSDYTPTKTPYLSGSNSSNVESVESVEPPRVNVNIGIVDEWLQSMQFPVEVFPENVRNYINEVAESVSCSRDFVSLGVLATLSAAIGDTRRISIKESWSQSAALYCAIVGYPGTKKSPALKFATKPLRKRAAKMHEDYQQLKASYEEQLAHSDKDDPPQPPLEYQNYIDDVTIEKVADILETNRRGVCLLKDELSSWLSSMDQYKGGKGGERSKWLSIFDNEAFRVDRKTSESQYVPSPYVTIIGSIQPERIALFEEEMGDGLIDRFLTVFPMPVQEAWTDQEVTKESEEKYEAIVNDLYKLDFGFYEKREIPHNVSITPEAKKILVETYNQLVTEKSTPGFPRRLANVWQKLETNWLRIALILAMVRISEARLQGHTVMENVTAEDMKNSVKLLDFFKSQMRILHGEKKTNTDLFSIEFARFIESNGRKWEGYSKELFIEFESELKAADEREFGKQIMEVAQRSPLIRLEKTRKNKGMFISLELIENVNTIHTIHTIHSQEEDKGFTPYIKESSNPGNVYSHIKPSTPSIHDDSNRRYF